jgi:hypothetical protein
LRQAVCFQQTLAIASDYPAIGTIQQHPTAQLVAGKAHIRPQRAAQARIWLRWYWVSSKPMATTRFCMAGSVSRRPKKRLRKLRIQIAPDDLRATVIRLQPSRFPI